MNYEKCKKCGCWHWDKEPCGDEYTVFHEDYLDEEGKKIYGNSFNNVAEKYARYYDGCDHDLINNEIEIEIEDKNEVRKKFTLSAEPSIYYNVNELE